MDERTQDIIAAAIEVHRCLGPGMVEYFYESALSTELTLRGIPFKRQVWQPVSYKGVCDGEFRLDLVVRDEIVIELKAVEVLLPVHEAQLISYLHLTGLPVGLLMNFRVPVLTRGIRRVTREHPRDRAARRSRQNP